MRLVTVNDQQGLRVRGWIINPTRRSADLNAGEPFRVRRRRRRRRAEPPEDRPWKMRDLVLVDPSDVLWRIAQDIPE
jgi:hypothetical protein